MSYVKFAGVLERGGVSVHVSESRRCHPGFGQGAAPGRWQPAEQTSFFIEAPFAGFESPSSGMELLASLYESLRPGHSISSRRALLRGRIA